MSWTDLESLGETRELARCLSPMIQALPEGARKTLAMTELDGKTQQQAAEALRISLSGMKSRVQRTRRRLRGMLLECCRIEVDRRGGIVAYSMRDKNSSLRWMLTGGQNLEGKRPSIRFLG